MDIEQVIRSTKVVLTETALIELLTHSGQIALHPRLYEALLIYDAVGRQALSHLYNECIAVAHKADVPILVGTPTWRANYERLSEAQIPQNVNRDAVTFLKKLRAGWEHGNEMILIGGTIGCQHDCYQPDTGLSTAEAQGFHGWQLDRLAEAGADVLMATTLPAVPEATGIGLAMERTGLPYILSFVINRQGTILDGTPLEQAFEEIDATCRRPPLGYMINCAYPSFLNAEEQPEGVFSRLIGYRANASSRDQTELEGAGEVQADDLTDWGEHMIHLNTQYGLTILGGCCGTRVRHLQYLVDHMHRD